MDPTDRYSVINNITKEEHFFSLSLKELAQEYSEILQYSDAEFREKLPNIAHFACIACWINNKSKNETIGDMGIVHELIHLMCLPETDLQYVRDLFAKVCFSLPHFHQ